MRILITIILVALAVPAWAERRALVIVNTGAQPAAQLAEERGLVRALQSRGFATVSGRAMTAEQMRGLLSDQYAGGDAADRMVIVLLGDFVHSGRGAWFLGIDGVPEAPDASHDLARIGAVSIDLATVFEVASLAPGGAVVLLGESANGLVAGAGLASGAGPLADLPQGITVVRGPASAIGVFMRLDLLRPGVVPLVALNARPDLEGLGLLLPGLPFIPAGEAQVPDASRNEDRDWDAARRADTAAAYQGFLDRWPSGRFAEQARAALAALTIDPVAAAKVAEDALGLSREERRAIQRALTDLGYNTRGIDGIFGPGTRSAVSSWQAAGGRPETGFLDSTQLSALQDDADAARAARDREDRAYWQATGALGDEAGLRAYLGRYPSGLFADVAKARIAAFDAEREAAEAARDRAAWNRAQRADTARAYRQYIDAFPRGDFVAEARARIAQLEGPTPEQAAWNQAQAADTVAAYRAYLAQYPRGSFSAQATARIAELASGSSDDAAWNRAQRENTVAAYRAYIAEFPNGAHVAEAEQMILFVGAREREEALNLPVILLVVIEQRLAMEGFDPGQADGNFTAQTRTAIAAFQRSRGLPDTGYLDARTLAALAINRGR